MRNLTLSVPGDLERVAQEDNEGGTTQTFLPFWITARVKDESELVFHAHSHQVAHVGLVPSAVLFVVTKDGFA